MTEQWCFIMIRCLIAPLDWAMLHRLLYRAFFIFTHFLLLEVAPRVLWILFDLLGLASWRFKGFIDHYLGWARFFGLCVIVGSCMDWCFLSFIIFAVPYYYSRTCWNSFRSVYSTILTLAIFWLVFVTYITYSLRLLITRLLVVVGGGSE